MEAKTKQNHFRVELAECGHTPWVKKEVIYFVGDGQNS